MRRREERGGRARGNLISDEQGDGDCQSVVRILQHGIVGDITPV